MSESLRGFLEDRVQIRRDEQSPSEAIDQGLKFLRSYICFTFPRQLSAIQSIHRDVERTGGRKSVANYQVFISMAEVMFRDPNVFTLDEFGIPFSLGSKILPKQPSNLTLQDAIDHIRQSEFQSTAEIHPFEIEILKEVIPVLPKG